MSNIIGGFIALALGIWGLIAWWWLVVEVLEGVIPILLILGGLVAIAAGVKGIEKETAITTNQNESEKKNFKSNL